MTKGTIHERKQEDKSLEGGARTSIHRAKEEWEYDKHLILQDK